MISKTNINLIRCKDINQNSIDTTEEILPQNITKFVKQNLELLGIKTSKHTKLHHLFYPNLQKYQICFFDTNKKFYTIFDFLLKKFENDIKASKFCAIFVKSDENYCVIFHESQLFHFSKLDFSGDFKDIATFFEKRLEIQFDKIFEIYETEFNSAKGISKIFHNLEEKPIFEIFVGLNIVFIMIFFVFIFYEFVTSQSIIKEQIEQKNEILKSLISNQKELNLLQKMDTIFTLFNKNELILKSLEFENNAFIFEGFGQDRTKLEAFFKHSGCVLIKSDANSIDGIYFVAKYQL